MTLHSSPHLSFIQRVNTVSSVTIEQRLPSMMGGICLAIHSHYEAILTLLENKSEAKQCPCPSRRLLANR